MIKDKYPDMGKKIKKHSLDECFELVKEKYPTAYMEGAAGLARSFFIYKNGKPTLDTVDKSGTLHLDKPLLVGVCWSSGKVTKDWNYVWWVRVAPEPREW